MTTVCVFGGTGFLGRRIARRFAGEGATVRVAVRHPDSAQTALRAAAMDRINVLHAVAGADAVVNAVSAYVEKGGVRFEAVHEQGARNVAQAARAVGATRLVHLSGIGSDAESSSPYIRARGRGELVVRQAFPGATVVRPCVMFGPDDALFGAIADLARRLPALPLIGGGGMRLQPAYVADVAEAIGRIVAAPAGADETYELAGPRVYTLRELVGLALGFIDKRRPLVPVPFAIARPMARLFELLPSPPLNTGQVDLLEIDTVASGVLPGFRELGIQPASVEQIVPSYIGRSRGPGPD
jgi:uncharacterized protein YbjT (DUF2867 family)